jgi:hypothetical protein
MRWSNEEESILIKDYPRCSIEELLLNLPKRTWQKISLKASSLGLKRDIYWSTRRKSQIDFTCIDSETKAYLLGFISADGFITSPKNKPDTFYFKVELSSRDVQHLEMIRDIISPASPIYNYKRTTPLCEKENYYSQLVVCDKVFCKQLIGWGVLKRKSTILRPPSLNYEFENHYIRGLFDGDGYVSDSKKLLCGIYGTKGILDYIDKRFNNYYPHKPRLYMCKGTPQLIYGSGTAEAFLNFIYHNSSIFLDRKYKKAKKYLKEN